MCSSLIDTRYLFTLTTRAVPRCCVSHNSSSKLLTYHPTHFIPNNLPFTRGAYRHNEDTFTQTLICHWPQPCFTAADVSALEDTNFSSSFILPSQSHCLERKLHAHAGCLSSQMAQLGRKWITVNFFSLFQLRQLTEQIERAALQAVVLLCLVMLCSTSPSPPCDHWWLRSLGLCCLTVFCETSERTHGN